MKERIWVIIGSTLGSILVLTGLVVVMSPRTEAAVQTSIVVDTLEDELNDDGDCSLREAIEAANTNTGVDGCPAGDGVMTDTITFQVAGAITLTGQLVVGANGPLTIDGGEVITVNGDSSVRAFWVETEAQLTLRYIAIEHVTGWWDGYDDGGAVYNDGGQVTVVASQFACCMGRYGGAIHNSGALTVSHSVFREGEADFGGAIRNSGVLTVTGCVFREGEAVSGGAIFNSGKMIVYDSTMSENMGSFGGGVLNYGTASIINSHFLSNTAPPDFWLNAAGGGVYNTGRLTLIGSVVSGNVSLSGPGGGIDNYGTLIVISSTISHNVGNSDGGGINSEGVLTVTNSTLSGNNVVAGARGGGIKGWGKWTITNSTIAGNTAQYGGGILCNGCEVSLYNTIVANNPTGGDCVTWSTGIITDGGHNLDSDGTCSLDPANGSLPNTDPLLDELRDNGGPTPTHALLPGSPAIDSADPDHCPASDQRGVPRPIDGDGDGSAVCDMGAYEHAPIPVEADFVARPTAGPPPLTVVFTNTSTGDYEASLWLFGDGVTSTLPGPTHTYTAAGVYTVTLTVDGLGGTDTEVKPRYITAQYGIYLPLMLRSG